MWYDVSNETTNLNVLKLNLKKKVSDGIKYKKNMIK